MQPGSALMVGGLLVGSVCIGSCGSATIAVIAAACTGSWVTAAVKGAPAERPDRRLSSLL
ncbi:MAG: hypothetical protein KBG15_03890 [Kofleriaceae bacterium]|nr:hypothetical protein [Kofleriaceae bacterium]